MTNINEILKKHWGYDAFRPGQRTIIESVLADTDTLALLPTGGGKSICYQVPGMSLPGVTVVVSPLIALMYDQVNGLKSKGIPAVALTSNLTYRELDTALDNAVVGTYKFIFTSPERLKTELFIERFKRMNISMIAVDEAHCISQWGYDFRPVYLEIAKIREFHPKVPVLALTATATNKVAGDICERLEFKKGYRIIKGDFKRENLSYFIDETEQKEVKLFQILNKNKNSAIIYLRTRRKCKETAEMLTRKGYSADYYHAGLSPEKRKSNQDKWINNKIRIICATNAFGMGIDKPDVRTVIHLDLCDDPESYFQEAGRAGRDGNKSFAVTLFNRADIDELNRRFQLSYPPAKEIKLIYKALGNFFQLAQDTGEGRSFEINIEKFCKQYNFFALTVFNAFKILERDDYLTFSTDLSYSSRLKFNVNNQTLYNFKLQNKKMQPLIDVVLRTYDNAFDDYINIFESKMAMQLNTSPVKIKEGLRFLMKNDVIDYIPKSGNPFITYTRPRVADSRFELSPEAYNLLKARADDRRKAIIDFVTNKETCRSRLLLKYFDQSKTDDCGICDVCIRKQQKNATSKSVCEYIFESDGCNLNEIKEALPQYTPDSLVEEIRFLADDKKIEIKNGKYYPKNEHKKNRS